MKFAKELEQELVPEWRVKYLDYKAGKKHVKAVARAAARMAATPRHPPTPALQASRSLYGATAFTPRVRPPSTLGQDSNSHPATEPARANPPPKADSNLPVVTPSAENQKTPPMDISRGRKSPTPSEAATAGNYGSFVPTPPARKPHPFELPEPAITPDLARRPSPQFGTPLNNRPRSDRPAPLRTSSVNLPNAYEVGPTTPPPKSGFNSLRGRIAQQRTPRSTIRRMFTSSTPLTTAEHHRVDTDMVAFDQVRTKQKDFFKFMDKELVKIEEFYKSKEDEAGRRLEILREQLHEMRNRRIEEVAAAQQAKLQYKNGHPNGIGLDGNGNQTGEISRPTSRDALTSWLDPLERVIGGAKVKAFGPHIGSNSKALQKMRNSPHLLPNNNPNNHDEGGKDFVRRLHHADEVPYRTAKRKLKLALQEFYRSMELLKSYALLNRTAFRKINKKYDKAIDAHPPLRYMTEKVSKAWFVQSDVLDAHLHAVEDLYARYFERGNHKVAVGKLRSSSGKGGDQSASAFQNGVLIGTGAVFSIQGIIYGRDLLLHPDPTVVAQTSYLLQIYAGYFLALYLFCWFCLCCSVWTRHKINYVFVFEFDPRHNLDWRQLSEFPSFLLLILGLFVWVNFTRYGAADMYIYFPVILIFATIVIIFFPGPILYHRSRKWFVYSNWRLLLAGLYPVEFRDFFLGDMFCSLTYFTANIELFFCLYANYWKNPSQCNSTHSRLLGFFTALPAIWRTLQCLRRYYDTRNFFPHLVNCGKYGMTILYYVTLSMYRIDQTNSKLALFATFAVISSIYSSIWDILMDWSLLQPNSSKRLLRDVRGFKSTWWYYGAMIIDPILRFNWIFYALYTHQVQHSATASFLVAFSEVTRRGIWTLFRVENEHCSNVARFKASRDVPLPYSIHTSSDEEDRPQTAESATEENHVHITPTLSRNRSHTGTALEAQPMDGGSLRRRPTPVRTFTKVLADAHTQDFEKRRKPGKGETDSTGNRRRDGDSSVEEGDSAGSSDEEDNEDQDLLDAEALIRETSRDRRDPSPDRRDPRPDRS